PGLCSLSLHDALPISFHTFALTVLERVLSLLHERAPAVRLEFVQLDPEDALVEVLARRVDIAIIDEYPGFPLPPSQGLVATLLADRKSTRLNSSHVSI